MPQNAIRILKPNGSLRLAKLFEGFRSKHQFDAEFRRAHRELEFDKTLRVDTGHLDELERRVKSTFRLIARFAKRLCH